MTSSDDDAASVTDGTEEVLHRLIGTGSENKKANINKAANSNNIYNRSQTLEDFGRYFSVRVRLWGGGRRLVVPLVIVFEVFLVLVILVFICRENGKCVNSSQPDDGMKTNRHRRGQTWPPPPEPER